MVAFPHIAGWTPCRSFPLPTTRYLDDNRDAAGKGPYPLEMVNLGQNFAPRLEFLLRLSVQFGTAIEIRPPAGPRLDISYFKSGTVAGPRLSGDVLGGGGDWALYQTSDFFNIDARAVLRLAAGELVYLQYQGIWRARTGVLAKLFASNGFKHFVPKDHHIQVYGRFQTASDRFAWLNQTLALGIGSLSNADTICYDFYEIT